MDDSNSNMVWFLGNSRFLSTTSTLSPLKEQKMATDIRDKIKASLRDINPRVEGEVVEYFAEKEAKRRAEALVKVIEKLELDEKELAKLGMDHVIVDEKGKPIQEGYTKSRLEQRNKTSGRVEKARNAINKAIDDDDYNPLYQLASSGGGGQDKGKNKPEDTGADGGDTTP